jgi:hypothetical protein
MKLKPNNLRVAVLVLVLVLAACNGDAVPDRYDWCYNFDFTQSNSWNVSYGSWQPGVGYLVDSNYRMVLSYTHSSTVYPQSVVITASKPGANDTSIAAVGEVFGIYREIYETIPGALTNGQFVLSPPSASTNGSSANITLQASDNVTVQSVTIYGLYENPFGVSNCGNLDPTATVVIETSTPFPTAPPGTPTPTAQVCPEQSYIWFVSNPLDNAISDGTFGTNNSLNYLQGAVGQPLALDIGSTFFPQVVSVSRLVIYFDGQPSLSDEIDVTVNAQPLGVDSTPVITQAGLYEYEYELGSNISSSSGFDFVFDPVGTSLDEADAGRAIVTSIQFWYEPVSCSFITPTSTETPNGSITPSPTTTATPTCNVAGNGNPNLTYWVSQNGSWSGNIIPFGTVFVTRSTESTVTLPQYWRIVRFDYEVSSANQGMHSRNVYIGGVGGVNYPETNPSNIAGRFGATLTSEIYTNQITFQGIAGTGTYLNIQNVRIWGCQTNPTSTPTASPTQTTTSTPQSTANPNTPTPNPTFTPRASATIINPSRTPLPVFVPPSPTPPPPPPNISTSTPTPLIVSSPSNPTASATVNFAATQTQAAQSTATLPILTNTPDDGLDGDINNIPGIGEAIGFGQNMLSSISNWMNLGFAWLGNMSSTVNGITNQWYLTAPKPPPGVWNCTTNPFEHEVCAIWYILENTIFSGVLGNFIVGLMVLLIDLNIIFTFIRMARAILVRIAKVINS